MSFYRLAMRMLTRDIALSTAVGVAAGMRAGLSMGEGESIDGRVDAEMNALLDQMDNALPAIREAEVQTAIPPKRGVGRPRKETEGQQ